MKINSISLALVSVIALAAYAATPTLPTPIARGTSSEPVTNVVQFPLGVRQLFNPSSTNAGVNIGVLAGDPSSVNNGDMWYSSTSGRLRLGVGGTSADVLNGRQSDYLIGSVSSASSIAIDLSAQQYQTCTLTHDATLTTANRPASGGRAVTVFFTASGATRTVTISGSWVNFGATNLLSIASGKQAFVTVMALGSAETDVRVASGVSQ